MGKGILYAATVGLIGAAIWGAIAYYADMELGLVAWGIGAAVGAAMFAGAQGSAGLQTGIAALVIALVSITAGKYVMVELVFNEVDDDWSEEESRLANDMEYSVSYLADDVIGEYVQANKPLDFPPSANMDYPESSADYPADVWAEAETRWQAMTPDQQQSHREQVLANNKQAYDLVSDELKQQGFLASFSLFDLLWFGLGGFSAFKLGAGVTNS